MSIRRWHEVGYHVKPILLLHGQADNGMIATLSHDNRLMQWLGGCSCLLGMSLPDEHDSPSYPDYCILWLSQVSNAKGIRRPSPCLKYLPRLSWCTRQPLWLAALGPNMAKLSPPSGEFRSKGKVCVVTTSFIYFSSNWGKTIRSKRNITWGNKVFLVLRIKYPGLP